MVSNFVKKLKEQFNTVKENMSKNNKEENVNTQNVNNKVNSISKAIVPTVQSTANEFKKFQYEVENSLEILVYKVLPYSYLRGNYFSNRYGEEKKKSH